MIHQNFGVRASTPPHGEYLAELPQRMKAVPSMPKRFEMECSFRVREGLDLRMTRSFLPIRRPDSGVVRAKPARAGSTVHAYLRQLPGDLSKLATFHIRSLRPSGRTRRHQIPVACEGNGWPAKRSGALA